MMLVLPTFLSIKSLNYQYYLVISVAHAKNQNDFTDKLFGQVVPQFARCFYNWSGSAYLVSFSVYARNLFVFGCAYKMATNFRHLIHC